MKQEINISRPPIITPHKLCIIRRSLIFTIPRQHALQANTHALHIVHRTPRLLVQQVQTNDPVRVDVRVHRDVMGGITHEDHFRRLDWVGGREAEGEPEGFGRVERVCV